MIGTLRISLEALRRNAWALRDLVAPAKAAFVVKSNAYGHGLIPVALAIEEFADRLCVFNLEEALALREGGVSAPILILGPVPAKSLREALAIGVELTLWDHGSYLRDLTNASRAADLRARVHIKIDTGVARFGLPVPDVQMALQKFVTQPHLEIVGVSSHLASAEELNSPFTLAQLERFSGALEQARGLFAAHKLQPIRHIAASAAAMLWPQMRLDMVRIGIALYGLWPSPETRDGMQSSALRLEPALRYESVLAGVRDVEAQTPIGYGCAYTTSSRTRIGIVPLGYADGIPRLLSNRGSFVVGGERRPIAGRVSMNVTLLDLGECNISAGTPVTLIGNDGDESVQADDWAGWAETINYEIVARLPSDLTRKYE